MTEIRMVWRVKAIVRMTDGGMAGWWANAIKQGWELESIELVGGEEDKDLQATFALLPDDPEEWLEPVDEEVPVLDPDEFIL
jgi:hypothetical protein